MDSLKDENIKSEQVCRTCLIDEGHFFNISDTFDHYTLTQMIQNITNLQIHPTDGYTQSMCFECVKEVRRANKFRNKCLESYNTLTKVEINIVEIPISVCKVELPNVEEIKQEVEESCDNADNAETEDECKSELDNESDCEDDEDSRDENTRKYDKAIRKKKKDGPMIIFNCPLCQGLFSSDSVYEKHISDLHPDRLNDDCFKQKRQALGNILKKKISNKTTHVYKCSLDEFNGKSLNDFRNHMKEHFGDKPIVCVDCGFRTNDIPLLKKHRLQKHTLEKRFSCTYCDYTCQTNSALKSHLPIHTLERNCECKLCPMKFKRPSELSEHKKVVHEKRKPHVCSVCLKAFFHSTALKSHMRTHTGERPHVCHYCGMAFSHTESMKTHVQLKHEPMPTLFKCDRCEYSTKQKIQLKYHIMRHNGDKCFKCPQCPYSTVLKKSLNEHIKRHSAQKIFSCDLCDYKGATNSAVIQHTKRVHIGEKPFPCTICEYRGKTRQTLTRHMETHCTEQKFECPNCPYKTNVREILLKHIRRNCVIKKRGRTPSKSVNIPTSNVMMNEESEEDTKESVGMISSNILQ